MLMKTNDVDLILLSKLDELIDICVIDSELAFGSACDYLVSLSGS